MKSTRTTWLSLSGAALLTGWGSVTFTAHNGHCPTAAPGAVAKANPAQREPASLSEVLAFSAPGLAKSDIGLMNLLCAQGLRGAENLNIADACAKLDDIARRVEFETKRHLYRFKEKPSDYNDSEGYFRMLVLSTVLQEDLGIHYNPDRITESGVFAGNERFFSDAADVFIHGLIGDRRSGTCSSLPVFYVAIGRRLGYPLKLVSAKNHLFVRWEDERQRFNIEATGVGFNSFADGYYKTWPLAMSEAEIKDYGYLKSLTPSEELAAFTSLRAHCQMVMGRTAESVASHATALRLAPESLLYRQILARAQAEASQRAQPVLAQSGVELAIRKNQSPQSENKGQP
jgi:hypothetical protein